MKFLGLFISILCFILINVSAQQNQEVNIDTVQNFTGIKLQYDVSRHALNALTQGRTDFEGMVDVDIKPNLYAVVEGGYTKLNRDRDYYIYESEGFYYRLGLDKNTNKKSDDIISFGFRYGGSFFNYSFPAVYLEDTISQNFTTISIPEINKNAHWIEAVFMLKVEIFTNFYLGWGVRGKLLVWGKRTFDYEPYLIPGFGRADRRAVAGFNYYAGFEIPL